MQKSLAFLSGVKSSSIELQSLVHSYSIHTKSALAVFMKRKVCGCLYWTQWIFSGMQLFKMMDWDWIRFHAIPILKNILWHISLYVLDACLYMWQVQRRCKEKFAGIHNKSESINHLQRASKSKEYLNHPLILSFQVPVSSWVWNARLCKKHQTDYNDGPFLRKTFKFMTSNKSYDTDEDVQRNTKTTVDWTWHGSYSTTV